MIERRTFLAKAGGAAALAGAAMLDAPEVVAQPKFQWRLSTAWPKQLDMLQGAAHRLAQVVEEMSGGRFRIEVFPGGQIMQPFECFEAASKVTIEAFMAASYYWTASEPAADWFTSVPFGMDPQGMAIWYYQGGGLKLWEETYAPFNLVPRLGPGFAPQMGGWFRRKINTIADYKGLKTLPSRSAADPRPCAAGGDPGRRAHGFPRQERDRPRATQDGIQGQGRADPAPGPRAARAQEAGGRGHQGALQQVPDGQEGARLVHEVPVRLGSPWDRVAKAPTINSSDLGLRRSLMTERRRFLVKAGGALAAVAAAAIVDAPNVIAQPKVQVEDADDLDPRPRRSAGLGPCGWPKVVEEMSGGRFRIEVSPAGQIMPPLGVFDAASQGTVEAFMGSTVHWPTKDPALEWFMTVPFGMNPEGMVAWYYQGDGLKLWEETYAAFNLVPRQGPALAPQMAGWFRKKINTIADFKGLKMRIPGLGGKVVTKAGGTAVLIPGGEIYAALERGVIDASEWVGPHDDMKLGLHNTARYYYYPGWHEPGTDDRVRLQQEGVRGAPGRPAADRSTTRSRRPRSMASRTSTRRTRSRSSSSRRSSRARSRCSRSRRRCCAISRSWRPRSSGKNPRRAPWPGRSTRPSRSSRRWWAPGTTSRKAPTISSWRCDHGDR